MNDEIKEILDYWRFYINEPNNYKLLTVHFDELKKILDYITNLQQENERLNHQLEVQEELTERNRLRKHCYKSRIEKAIEYIKEQYKYFEGSDKNWQPVLDNKKLLNILDGKSDE